MTLPTTWNKLTDWRVLFAITGTVAALFMFVNLSGLSLRNWDEGIHAEVSREVLEKHDWVTMHFMGGEYFRKPPLKFVLSAAVMTVTGPTEWAVRAPNAAAGVLVTLLILLWIWQVTRERWAIPTLGVLFLSTTTYFMHTFRSGETDGVLTLFIIAAIYAYWRAKTSPRWLYWSAAAIGLSIMTKSAAGLVPLIVMAIDATVTHSWKTFGWKRFLWSVGIVTAIVAPWHIIELAHFGKRFWNDYFFLHIIERGEEAIVNPTAGPFWYFKIVWSRLYPTLLFTLAALLVLLRSLIRDRVRDVRFLWGIWFTIGFIVVTTAKSKLDWYLFPYYFPLLLLTTQVVIDWLKRTERDWLRTLALLAVAIGAFTTLPDRVPKLSSVHFLIPQFFLKLAGVREMNPLTVAVGTVLAVALVLWIVRRFVPAMRVNERSERLALAVLVVYLSFSFMWIDAVRIVREKAPLGYNEAMAFVESRPDTTKTILLYSTSIWSNPAGYFYWHRHNVGVVRDAKFDPANLELLSRDPGTYVLMNIDTPIPTYADRPLRLLKKENEILVLDRP